MKIGEFEMEGNPDVSELPDEDGKYLRGLENPGLSRPEFFEK